MSHLQELADRCADLGLVVLGFNSSDQKEIALQFLEESEATFLNLLDTSDEAVAVGYRGYRCSGVPLSYIIDREGKVADAWYGYQQGHPRALRVLEALGVAPTNRK